MKRLIAGVAIAAAGMGCAALRIEGGGIAIIIGVVLLLSAATE